MRGSGEYERLRASRLHAKPWEGGLRRKGPSSASVGRVRRKPHLVLNSHTDESRHRNTASDPKSVADDG